MSHCRRAIIRQSYLQPPERKTSKSHPQPLENLLLLDPPPLRISVALSGEGIDISWNYTSLRNWGVNISVAAMRDFWDCYKGRGKKKNRPIADRHAPNNDPRNTCGTHFGSSFRLVFKVANGSSWISEAPIPSFYA